MRVGRLCAFAVMFPTPLQLIYTPVIVATLPGNTRHPCTAVVQRHQVRVFCCNTLFTRSCLPSLHHCGLPTAWSHRQLALAVHAIPAWPPCRDFGYTSCYSRPPATSCCAAATFAAVHVICQEAALMASPWSVHVVCHVAIQCDTTGPPLCCSENAGPELHLTCTAGARATTLRGCAHLNSHKGQRRALRS